MPSMQGWEESRLILRGAFVARLATNEEVPLEAVGSSFRGDGGVPVTTVNFKL